MPGWLRSQRERREARARCQQLCGAGCCCCFLQPSPGSSSWGQVPHPSPLIILSPPISSARGAQLNLPENTGIFPKAAGADAKLTVRKSLGKLLQSRSDPLSCSLALLPLKLPLTGFVTELFFFFFFNKEIKCKLPCHCINDYWV